MKAFLRGKPGAVSGCIRKTVTSYKQMIHLKFLEKYEQTKTQTSIRTEIIKSEQKLIKCKCLKCKVSMNKSCCFFQNKSLTYEKTEKAQINKIKNKKNEITAVITEIYIVRTCIKNHILTNLSLEKLINSNTRMIHINGAKDIQNYNDLQNISLK